MPRDNVKTGAAEKRNRRRSRKWRAKIISTDHFPDGSVNISHFSLEFKEKSEVLKFLLIMPKNYVNCVM